IEAYKLRANLARFSRVAAEKEGEDRYYKGEAGNGNLPFNLGVSYADMVRHLPRSKQYQGRNDDVQMQQ
ncbi:hypothetical protein Ancab_011345, partial [Ancistrocladus abbreviatus]